MSKLSNTGNLGALVREYKGKSVYVFLLSSGMVKIGVSGDVRRRIKEIERITKQDVKEWYASAPFVNSYQIEEKIHQKYKENLIDGEYEYFNIPYREAVEYTKHYGDIYGKMEVFNREQSENTAKQMISYFHPELNGVL